MEPAQATSDNENYGWDNNYNMVYMKLTNYGKLFTLFKSSSNIMLDNLVRTLTAINRAHRHTRAFSDPVVDHWIGKALSNLVQHVWDRLEWIYSIPRARYETEPGTRHGPRTRDQVHEDPIRAQVRHRRHEPSTRRDQGHETSARSVSRPRRRQDRGPGPDSFLKSHTQTDNFLSRARLTPSLFCNLFL